jgi:hypothetical protein
MPIEANTTGWPHIIQPNAEGVIGMAAQFRVRIGAGAQAVHHTLRECMAHVELVSEDVYRSAGGKDYIAVLLYQQYFIRVGNQVALMLLISGDSQTTTVKSVACASSRDILLSFDLGAAGDFAAEPINLLRDLYPGRVYEVPSQG